ncbi:hypothetical protein LENED_007727 [Lentinula edodes]|uniref:Uncharacterized protein n=1 Tax=Lentinula edodes TaxID=5353 RepID=A0A1Q3EF87_LENED|nr:hypothetical protein LENED_007727 [Lentinula edodes]
MARYTRLFEFALVLCVVLVVLGQSGVGARPILNESGLAARDDSDSDSSDGICITCLDRIVYHNGHKEPHIGDIELA